MGSDSPLAPLLDGARLKVDRAVEHLIALRKEWETFLKTNPYGIDVDFDAKAGCHVAALRIRSAPPPRLGVIVGDLAHNLRSALDHTAWRLAGIGDRAHELSKPRVRRKVSFPITASEADFRCHPAYSFFPDEPRAVVEALQPYDARHEREWGQRTLARIHRLSNTDKHRVLHTTLGMFDLSEVGFTPAAVDVAQLLDDLSITRLVGEGESLHDGTKVAEIRFPHPTDPHATKVDVSRQPRPQILVTDTPYVLSEFDLGDLCRHTGFVISQFDRFLR